MDKSITQIKSCWAGKSLRNDFVLGSLQIKSLNLWKTFKWHIPSVLNEESTMAFAVRTNFSPKTVHAPPVAPVPPIPTWGLWQQPLWAASFARLCSWPAGGWDSTNIDFSNRLGQKKMIRITKYHWYHNTKSVLRCLNLWHFGVISSFVRLRWSLSQQKNKAENRNLVVLEDHEGP